MSKNRKEVKAELKGLEKEQREMLANAVTFTREEMEMLQDINSRINRLEMFLNAESVTDKE